MVHELTFKHFLEARIKDMDAPEHSENLEVLADIVRKSGNYKPDGDPYIWRGEKRALPASVVNPGSGRRSSENTYNYYTILFDENPANSKYPKRSESFICTTNFTTAKKYARAEDRVLAIYPLEEQVASVNMPDIWHIKMKLKRLNHIDSLPAINEMLYELIYDFMPKSTEEIIKQLRKRPVKEIRQGVMQHDFGGISSKARNASDEEFVEMLIADLQDSYNYEELGISLESVRSLPVKTEVWFSGKCVVIPFGQLDDFRKLLLNRG